MKVIMLEPGRKAEIKDIGEGLEQMQAAVGGYIEAVYPFGDPVAIVCNEDGKLMDLPLNRVLYKPDGTPCDVICGPAFICGVGEENFIDIPENLAEKYLEEFLMPEKLFFSGGQTIVMKYQPKED